MLISSLLLCALALIIGVFIAARKRLSVVQKLIGLCTLTGIGAITVNSMMSQHAAQDALTASESRALDAVAAAKGHEIKGYFNTIHEQITNFAQNLAVAEATHAFADAFAQLEQDPAYAAPTGGETYRAVAGYYENEFRPRLVQAEQTYRGTAAYVPQSNAGRTLQSWYIANNPNAVGEKLKLNRHQDPAAYNTHHQTYHPMIRRFLESFGYYDIFLFDTDANLVYSVFKETDFATNFNTGPYTQSNFGNAVRKALAASSPGAVFIEDFAFYEPSYGAPASFISAPVFHQGKKVGCAVFQMPVGRINQIMTDATGLGETGQTLLFGVDGVARSQDRFLEHGTILTESLDEQTRQLFKAQQSGIAEIVYRGHRSLTSYRPLELDGLDWAIVAEKQMSEVLAPVRALQIKSGLSSAVLAVIVGITAGWFTKRLMRPIVPITTRAGEIAAGDLRGAELPVETTDEFGRLTGAVNEMQAGLRALVAEMMVSGNEVAAAATEIDASAEEMNRGMQEQINMIDQITLAIQAMSHTAGQVTDQSKDACQQADSSGQSALEGGQQVQDTVDAMRHIAQSVKAGVKTVETLGERSDQIGQVIAVINDIADQTNLLALNAAIEAARAGEHGRGFAVVADEVRKLADRTTTATQEIAESIQLIQAETKQAVCTINAGQDQVENGVEKAAVAGQSLESIVRSSQTVSTAIQSISDAAQEQFNATQTIQENASAISDVCSRSAAGTEQASEAASQLSVKAESLRALCDRFSL